MDTDATVALTELVRGQDLGALGTLRASGAPGAAEPFVSMVPVAWLRSGDAVIHVSGLSPHTRDLLAHPQASLMLMAPRVPGDNPQALARVTVQVLAVQIDPSAAGHEAARAAYLARFPGASQTMALGDFSMFRLTPSSARFVAGFGRAHALRREMWRTVMSTTAPGE